MLFFLFDIKHIWYRIWNSQSVVGGVCFVSHSWGAHELIKMWQFKCETRSVSRITFFPRGEKNIENRNRITKEKKIYFYAYFVVCHLKLKLNHAEKKNRFRCLEPNKLGLKRSQHSFYFHTVLHKFNWFISFGNLLFTNKNKKVNRICCVRTKNQSF